MSTQAAIAFAGAAPRYWASVYPRVRALLGEQRAQAAAIPDPELRGLALHSLAAKRANIDGAAAFAAFVPARRRDATIRAVVAFQALYDYLDLLTERPSADPVAESRRLHGALSAALDAGGRDCSGGREFPGAGECLGWGECLGGRDCPGGRDCARSGDGGYLRGGVQRCRVALAELPAYGAVAAPAQRLAAHIVAFQSYHASAAPAAQADLARWARARTPPGSGLEWWETAASAGSSLGVFALIALAAQPGVGAGEAVAVEQAYFPWIGALHSLLDSLIDLEEDRAAGQPALIANYGDPAQAAARLRALALQSRRRAAALPGAGAHLALLASMASLYLAERAARAPHARAARRGVLRALGGLTLPATVVMRARRAVV
jgi:tetraprenyl-beta-curcumene synthase